jgi:hypothetical protein
MQDVYAGRQVAFNVRLRPPEQEQDANNVPLAPCIQEVVDKHSTACGTLCGDIPHGCTARGFTMHIDVAPGARPH